MRARTIGIGGNEEPRRPKSADKGASPARKKEKEVHTVSNKNEFRLQLLHWVLNELEGLLLREQTWEIRRSTIEKIIYEIYRQADMDKEKN